MGDADKADSILANVMRRMGWGPSHAVVPSGRREFPGFKQGTTEDVMWSHLDEVSRGRFRHFLAQPWVTSSPGYTARRYALDLAYNEQVARLDKEGKGDAFLERVERDIKAAKKAKR